MFNLDESKQLVIYRLLLNTFEEYCSKFQGSSLSKYLDYFLEAGKKIVPSDERAQNILLWILTCGTCGEAVAYLAGKRFSDLPVMIRPSYKEDGDIIKVANWGTKEKNYDTIGSLLGWDADTRKTLEKSTWVTSDIANNGQTIKLLNSETD